MARYPDWVEFTMTPSKNSFFFVSSAACTRPHHKHVERENRGFPCIGWERHPSLGPTSALALVHLPPVSATRQPCQTPNIPHQRRIRPRTSSLRRKPTGRPSWAGTSRQGKSCLAPRHFYRRSLRGTEIDENRVKSQHEHREVVLLGRRSVPEYDNKIVP